MRGFGVVSPLGHANVSRRLAQRPNYVDTGLRADVYGARVANNRYTVRRVVPGSMATSLTPVL
jgi:hypothetical protein